MGTHRITFVVSDGEFEVEAWVTLTVTEKADEPDGEGISTVMLAGISVVIVIVVVAAGIYFGAGLP